MSLIMPSPMIKIKPMEESEIISLAHTAEIVLKRQWRKAEKYISISPYASYLYSMRVVASRWHMGERAVAEDSYYTKRYITFLKCMED